MIQCPELYRSGDVTRAMYAAKQAELGSWPVAGGWLDQTQKCLDAIDFVKSDMAEWKSKHEAE